MLLSTYLFYFLSFVTLLSAIMVILSKNPVFSVLYLIITFFAISGHYILLQAQFLAAVNIIVYAGAIMVLFLYVIMMMNLNKENTERRKHLFSLLVSISAGLLLLSMVFAVKGSEKYMIATPTVSDAKIGSIENLGNVLFNQYMLPFEISSLLFLSAMVGAVFLSKKNLS